MRRAFLLAIAIVVTLFGTIAPGGRAATSARQAQAVVYQGYGFDTCKAPSV